MKLCFEKNYDDALNALARKKFYIFGISWRANLFYLHCKKRGIVDQIAAFVITELSRDRRKMHFLHGVPVMEISGLCGLSDVKHGFMATANRVMHDQIFPVMRSCVDGEAYYVDDFVHQMMLHGCMWECYQTSWSRYLLSENPYETGEYNISESGSEKTYKYAPRIHAGVFPDARIFGETSSLDALFGRQLGNYTVLFPALSAKTTAKKCKIYLVKSHFDKALQEEPETPATQVIQAGAALTEHSIAWLKDNTGDNISHRNRDYCEMTAVYWAWKNDSDSDYIGFCHYRRRYVLNKALLQSILSQEYDAVYTIPKLTDGGMREEFVERNYFLTPEMWELTGKAIAKLAPEYSESWEEFSRSYFLLPFNMSIMRRAIFQDYCAWLFPVLEEVDRFYLDRGIQRNDRYLGYIAECLNTVYAMKHKAWLKKCFVEIRFLAHK